MPIYEFRCNGCGEKVELILSAEKRNYPQVCLNCEGSMGRVVELPCNANIPETGREKILADLNSKEDGHGNYPHHKVAMWKGLNQREPVTGRGFG